MKFLFMKMNLNQMLYDVVRPNGSDFTLICSPKSAKGSTEQTISPYYRCGINRRETNMCSQNIGKFVFFYLNAILEKLDKVRYV